MKRNILAALSLAVVMLAGSVLSAAAGCPGGGGSCGAKGASASAASLQQATYAVSKVECKDCVAKITSALQKMDGIQTSGWDSKAKAMNVAFVPGKANTQAIAAAITGAGFPAKLVTVGNYSGQLCTPEMCAAMGQAACATHGGQCSAGAHKASSKKVKTSAGNSSM